MHYQGICHKMHAQLKPLSAAAERATVEYKMVFEHFNPVMNDLLGQQLQLEWSGRIFCVSCGSKTPKSYAQGHCFKCFKTNAACDMCIVKPETCHHHLGTCRDESFAQSVCFQPHQVYLANSSGLKVGITRLVNVPTRWLDQGATQALPILQVGTRRMAGWVEVMLAEQLNDKTDWRKLLKGESETVDLKAYQQQLLAQFLPRIDALKAQHPQDPLDILDQTALQFDYPVLHYPQKIVSHNLDKTHLIKGKLMGIKGQYLLLDTGVINLRKYSGYEITLSL